MNILAELRERFHTALLPMTDKPDEYASMVRAAQDARFGDFQANCAMPLQKEVDGTSREIAERIVAGLDVAELCEPPDVAGPGFINLKLRDDWLQSATNKLVADERLGVEPAASPQTIVVDYSAPNVAKPMHVGHLRSSVIGNALYRVLSFLGHKVIGDNHIGDWGTQFGMIIYGYKNFLDEAAFREDAVGELARLYRLVNQLTGYHEAVEKLPVLKQQLADKRDELAASEATADPSDKKAKKTLKKMRADVRSLEEAISGDDPAQVGGVRGRIEAVESSPALRSLAESHAEIATASRGETARLHAGDEENNRLWNEFVPACLAALGAMYERLGIEFELALGESFYQPMLADVVEDLQQKGLASESEGAICVFNEGFAAPFLVRKGDGAFNYATTDLATIKYRVEELKADVVLYVVDVRQGEHFQQLFETAARWGFGETRFRHVSFGTILGKDGKPFKTRSGDTVGLESLIDESIGRARTIVNGNDDAKPNGRELDEATRGAVAEAVGIGGIKYVDLMHNRESDYKFDWDKMLATKGNTAAYMQYACARIHGIFRRGNFDRDALPRTSAKVLLTQPAERALAFQLNRFSEALAGVESEYRPNILTQYLFETADVFARFFEECHVNKEPNPDVQTSRLLLCDLTERILVQGLSLLGIATCERM